MDFSRKTWILAASAVLIIAGTGLFFGLRYYYDRKAPDFMKEYTLYVYPDTEAGAVLDSLAAGASARREGSLRRCARSIGLEEGLKPGKYEILPEHSAAYVMRMLVNGWQTPQNLTLSGTIRSKGRLAKTIGLQMMADSSEIAAALEDTVFLADYGFTPENVFALFLPDTYEFYWTASVKSIFDRFKKEYDRFWTPERIALADAQGLTPMEASVMASIVNGETLQKQEYPMIAGVYLNRLHRGMKLQADPTVCFCFDYTLQVPRSAPCADKRASESLYRCGPESGRTRISVFLCQSRVRRHTSFRGIIQGTSPECAGIPACAYCASERAASFRAMIRAEQATSSGHGLFL